MIRNLKALCLALVAVVALSAITASAASATNRFFHSEKNPTFLTGEQHAGEDVFTTDSGKVTCNEAKYTGKISTGTTTQEITITPTYSKCHLVLIFTFNVTVDTNGCAYTFTAERTTGAVLDKPQVHIECPAGKVIEVTAPSCTVTVPPQTASGFTYTNKEAGTKRDVTVDVNIAGLVYEEHGGLCENETELTNNGTYVGSATVKGFSNEAHTTQQGVWYE